MIAEEIFSNIVQYAYKKANFGKVSIETCLKNNQYIFSFKDNGKEYNSVNTDIPDISSDINNRQIGGLGIFIIKKLADDISYTRENNTNILTVAVTVK